MIITAMASRAHATFGSLGSTLRKRRHVTYAYAARVCFALSTLAFALWAGNAAAGDKINATLARVVDGDTIDVLVRVRIAGIDAPERRQPYGKQAARTLELACGKGKLSLEITGKPDKYGRTIANVTSADGGVDVAFSMVRVGAAWVYRKYTDDQRLIDAENEARESLNGLWRDNQPIPPWEWRRGKR